VLSRLHNTGKFEIAELAAFTKIDDVRQNKMPWKVYPNAVNDDDPRKEQMGKIPGGPFGGWRFDSVCLDFKPDIVWDIRDYWMLAFENDSPLRPYFHWAIMPTVDSEPQHESWIETFIEADSVFTYSDWAQDVLKKQGGGKINLCGVASPGVDLDTYTPHTARAIHRQNMGIDPNINLIGTVMRNQKRKLYPDLFETFRMFIDKCMEDGKEDLARKTFLYVHSSYPDKGWSFPDLLKRYGLCHKVMFTYICRHCGNHFAAFFQDARTVCPNCRSNAAMLPTTSEGLDREQLAGICQVDTHVKFKRNSLS